MGASLGIRNTAAFRKAWADGVSQRKIGEMLGCSELTVSRSAIKFGYPKRLRPFEVRIADPEPAKRRDVRTVAVAGVGTYSGTEIRKEVSVPIEPWLQVEADEPEPVSEDALRAGWRAEVCDLLAEGFGCEDIALKLLCEPVDVQFEINRMRDQGVIRDVLGGRHA